FSSTRVPPDLHPFPTRRSSDLLYKARAERRLMRKSAKIAEAAHLRAMAVARPGVNERVVEAELLHAFRTAGAVPSYEPIVGGGRSEEHTSELQSREHLVCRLLL